MKPKTASTEPLQPPSPPAAIAATNGFSGRSSYAPLNKDAVGFRSTPRRVSWASKDSLLYALGVGAGSSLEELAFTTENTTGVQQRALPTMGVILARPPGEVDAALGRYDKRKLVHGSQSITIFQPIAPAGEITIVSEILGIYDKGSGAAVVTETRASDASGQPVFTTGAVAFVRGEGGWGGDRGPAAPSQDLPTTAPKHTVIYRVPQTQALLYRLSGDRNPLHSDPMFATAAGFDRPILHGLCTFGYVGRALLDRACDRRTEAFDSMEARFVSPMWPGDDLLLDIWDTGPDTAFFVGRRDGGRTVIAGNFRKRS
jgi:acyl dehydratase